MDDTAEVPNEPGVEEREPSTSSSAQPTDPCSFFAAQQPKHIVDGVTDGLRNLATGVVLGAACFVASPIAGMQRDGYVGAAKGVLSGAAGLLGMTAFGAVTAARQVVRGVVNTKSALESFSEGKVWYEPSREWISVDLHAMIRDVPSTDDDLFQQTSLAAQKNPNGPTAAFARLHFAPPSEPPTADPSRALYGLLGVDRSASSAEIKKAYVHMALKLHPDKNAHDPSATKKFQDLSDAYRVLSNPVSRAHYDATGSQSDAHADALYEALDAQLGCRAFLPFVGKLKWLIIMASPLRQVVGEVQRRRLVRIAVDLAGFLDDDELDSTTHQPRFSRVKIALSDMLNSKLGPSLVQVIGSAYADAARQFGEHIAVGICDNLVVDAVSTLGGITNTAVHAASTAYRSAVRKEPVAEDDMVELIRRISKNDVYDTVSKACELACKDLAIDVQTRQRRIIHLGFLGQLFLSSSADFLMPPSDRPAGQPQTRQ
jgi:hypothetical protein